MHACCFFVVFFFNDTATTEIYTLSLHDALPIYDRWGRKMAEWTDPNFEWDGSNLSGNVRPGVYMWEVAMTFSRNGEVLGHRDKGALTILK